MSLDRKILERIENENLEIRPKCFFVVKDIIFGTGTFLLSIFGSLSLALLFEIIKQQGKNLTWLSIPYAWVILLGVFLVAGYWLVIRINSLYKMRFVPIVLMLFFVNLSFGYLTFASGKAEKIEFELEKIPIYDVIMPINKEIKTPSDVIEKTESNNENIDVNDNDKKSVDDIKDDNKPIDDVENNKVNIQKNDFKIEIKEEDEDDEITEFRKIENFDKNEEDSDDSVRSEVKNASKEIIKNDDEEDEAEEDEEMDEEKSGSDNKVASLSEDGSEKDKIDISSDAAEED